jgi:hypothetical protein
MNLIELRDKDGRLLATFVEDDVAEEMRWVVYAVEAALAQPAEVVVS